MIKLKEIELYNTSIIQIACQDAMINNKMIGIVDFSGAGKSFGLNKFENSNYGVFKIELGPSTTPKEMYSQILNKLKNEDKTRNETTGSIIRQIRFEIADLTGKSLIVIDEAGRYEKERVSYFHELRNLTMNRCGLIICAHKDFEKNLTKWISNGVQGVEEFKNRFSYFVSLKRPQDNEIRLLFDTNKILRTKNQIELFNKIIATDKKSRNWRMIYHQIVGDKSMTEKQ